MNLTEEDAIEIFGGPSLALRCLGCRGLYKDLVNGSRKCPFCGGSKTISSYDWPHGCLVICHEDGER